LILSSGDIREAIKSGRIAIQPDTGIDKRIGPASVDFRLGRTFLVFERNQHPYLDPRKPVSTRGTTRSMRVEDGRAFIVHPGELVLASTVERLTLCADILARLEGRRSLGRLGIIVHSTASIFHPGWDGHPVMELGNLGVMPVALYPGMRICQFTFEPLSSKEAHPYGSSQRDKYFGQSEPLPSRIEDELEEELAEEELRRGIQQPMWTDADLEQ
jgi:dCTP deaminase